MEEDWVVTLPLLKTIEQKAWQLTPGFDAEQLEPWICSVAAVSTEHEGKVLGEPYKVAGSERAWRA